MLQLRTTLPEGKNTATFQASNPRDLASSQRVTLRNLYALSKQDILETDVYISLTPGVIKISKRMNSPFNLSHSDFFWRLLLSFDKKNGSPKTIGRKTSRRI